MEEERAGAGVIHGVGNEDEDEVSEEGVPHVEGDVPGDSRILTYQRIAVHASSPPTGVLNPLDTLHASTTIMNQVLQHCNHRRVLFPVFFDVLETDVILPLVFLVQPSSKLLRMHNWPVLPSVVVIGIPDVGGGRREFVVWGGGRGGEFSRGGGSERRSWMIRWRWW
ncbi:hypothetical protein C8J55DRAFT_494466 [Lentinula edodes]|uniref:Uncharacterized protein n=1 Tax=Lentinula lateritia TaxID=40482 RepID=A0A9W8ZNX6_9AGAR|nr:hypothetical protein C8J55DRAFT_494466 [Lentinula edodes]